MWLRHAPAPLGGQSDSRQSAEPTSLFRLQAPLGLALLAQPRTSFGFTPAQKITFSCLRHSNAIFCCQGIFIVGACPPMKMNFNFACFNFLSVFLFLFRQFFINSHSLRALPADVVLPFGLLQNRFCVLCFVFSAFCCTPRGSCRTGQPWPPPALLVAPCRCKSGKHKFSSF